jgi:predicted nucleic acid-binding protein
MARYILDTSPLVGYLRGSAYAAYIEKRYTPFTPPNIAAVSIVSVGELRSIAIQFNWGDTKRQALNELVRKIPRIDINNDSIIERYAEIDAYSQGKHPTKKLPSGVTARNMGKNDLWIAATASVLNATLLTMDHDFDHLNGVFLNVVYIDQSLKP